VDLQTRGGDFYMATTGDLNLATSGGLLHGHGHHAGRPIPGVNLLDQIEARFGWSDHDVADALRVWPSAVSRYRVNGVPNSKIPALRRLAEMSPGQVDPPRRLVPKRDAQRCRRSWNRTSKASTPKR
jgi:hypothetical protein